MQFSSLRRKLHVFCRLHLQESPVRMPPGTWRLHLPDAMGVGTAVGVGAAVGLVRKTAFYVFLHFSCVCVVPM